MLCGHCMIKYPIITHFISHNLRIVSCSHKMITCLDQYFMLVVEHRPALLIPVRSHQRLRPSHHRGIGTLQPPATTADGSKQIIIFPFLADISTFVGIACHPQGTGIFFQHQTVIGKFHGINAMKASEKQVFLSPVFDVKRINTISYPNFVAPEKHSMILERPLRSIGCSNSDATCPFPTPCRHGIIQNIFPVDLIDVGCPDASIRYEIRACTISKSSPLKAPVYQIGRTINRKIMNILGSIKPERSVVSTDHSRIGQTLVDDRVMILTLRYSPARHKR